MKRLNRIAVAAAGALCILGLTGWAQVPTREYIQTISLRDALDRPWEQNVLKLFDAAADSMTNRVYVTGIMTRNMALVDAGTGEVIDVVDTGILDNAHKYLFECSDLRSLYLMDTTNGELMRFDMDTNERVADGMEIVEMQNVAIDSSTSRLYRTRQEAPVMTVHDAMTLDELGVDCPACEAMTEGAGPITFAPDGMMYVLNVLTPDSNAIIYQIDQSDLSLVAELSFRVPGAKRVNGFVRRPDGSFIILTASNLYLFAPGGLELARHELPFGYNLEKFAYDPDFDDLYVLMLNPPVDGETTGIGDHLFRFKGEDLTETGVLEFGLKAHRMQLNRNNHKLYLANGDASMLWVVTPEPFSVDGIRIGDSIEGMAGGVNNSPLYVNSRLGGSDLYGLNPDTGELETFKAGTWPVPIRTSSDGEFLYALNAWDSTISVFKTRPSTELVTTIDLGIPRGTTDLIPDMVIDNSTNKAYAAYPEYLTLVAADLKTGAVDATIDLSDFAEADVDAGGPGRLQLLVVNPTNRLFVYSSLNHRLGVFDIAGAPVEVGVVDLSRLNWSRMSNSPAVGWLFYDEINGRLFLGPYEISPLDGTEAGLLLPAVQKVTYYDESNDMYWGLGDSSDPVEPKDQISWIKQDVNRLVGGMNLRRAGTVAPDLFIDAARARLYVSYMINADIEVYSLNGDLTPIPGPFFTEISDYELY